MEMVEEGNNQPKITPKRIKVEEIVEEEDRISALPDGLLLEILSRLPSAENAIRTGTLSKRWKYLWTSVPTLIFIHLYSDKRPLLDFASFVTKTLIQRGQLKLRKFVVDIGYDILFELLVNCWIRYAISCNVEELDLSLWNLDLEAVFQLNEDFFINSCFTDLRLECCIFNPTGVISWKKLRSLYIGFGYLDEDLIENILSGSPLLETLVLNSCYGYRCLDITSNSIKKLVFYIYWDPDDIFDDLADVIEIKAPNILSLSIQFDVLWWQLSLFNVSYLLEAKLDYTKSGECETTDEEEEEEMLKSLIQSLRHVKELKIGVSCFKVLFRLEAKGFIFPSNVKLPAYFDSKLMNGVIGISGFDNDSLEQGD